MRSPKNFNHEMVIIVNKFSLLFIKRNYLALKNDFKWFPFKISFAFILFLLGI